MKKPKSTRSVKSAKKSSKKSTSETLDKIINDVKFDWDKVFKSDTVKSSLPYKNLSETDKCRNDIVYFANNYFFITDPDCVKRILVYKRQCELLEMLVKNRNVIIENVRQTGVTTMLVIRCLHRLLFWPNNNILFIVPTFENSKHVMDIFKTAIENLQENLNTQSMLYTGCRNELVFSNGNSFAISSIDEVNCNNITANVIVADQVVSFPDQGKLMKLWNNKILKVMSIVNGQIILSSLKSMDEDNFFNDMCLGVLEDKNPDWTLFQTRWDDIPRSDEWKSGMIKRIGQEQWDRQYEPIRLEIDDKLTKEELQSLLKDSSDRHVKMKEYVVKHDKIIKELDEAITEKELFSNSIPGEKQRMKNVSARYDKVFNELAEENMANKEMLKLPADYQEQTLGKWQGLIDSIVEEFQLSFDDKEKMTVSLMLENLDECREDVFRCSPENIHESISAKYLFLHKVNVIAYYYLRCRKFMSVQPMNGPVGFAQNLITEVEDETVKESVMRFNDFLDRCMRTFQLMPWKFKKEYGIIDCTGDMFREKMQELYNKKFVKMPCCKIKLEKHVMEAKSVKFNISEQYTIFGPDKDIYSHDNAYIKGRHMARKLDDLVMSMMFNDVRTSLMKNGIQPYFHEFKMNIEKKKEDNGVFKINDMPSDVQAEASKLADIIMSARSQIMTETHMVPGNYMIADSAFREYFEVLTNSEKGADINFMGLKVFFMDNLPYFNTPNNLNMLIGYWDELPARNAVMFCPYIFIDYKESLNLDLEKVTLEEIFLNDLDAEPEKLWRSRFGYTHSKDIHKYFRMIEFNPEMFQASFKNLANSLSAV